MHGHPGPAAGRAPEEPVFLPADGVEIAAAP